MKESDIRKLLGYNLKRLRKQKKLSQMKLAENVGMAFTFISDIETGKKWISPETLEKFSNELSVAPYQFFLPMEFDSLSDKNINSFADEILNAFISIKEKYVD